VPTLAGAVLFATLASALVRVVAAAPPAAGTEIQDCANCPIVVVVPAGEFDLGSGARFRGALEVPAERQIVRVKIERPFALGKYEVTRAEFREFALATATAARIRCRTWDAARQGFRDIEAISWEHANIPANATDRHPATCIDWHDAQRYTEWLSARTGRRYRLPSEVEWEYAAKAGSRSLRPWGDAADRGCAFANTYDRTSAERYPLAWPMARCRDGFADIAPVGSLRANSFGLYDMIGNVWEWAEDCATLTYVGRPTDQRAWLWDGGCKRRIQRGGGWITGPDRSRPAFHGDGDDEDRADFVGFRVVRELALPSATANVVGSLDRAAARPAAGDGGRSDAGAAKSGGTELLAPRVIRDCADCPELALVPAGALLLGSSADAYEHDVASGETPPLAVSIRKAFALARHEATRRELIAFVTETGFQPRELCIPNPPPADPRRPDLVPAGRLLDPARCISARTAAAYLDWLSARTGKRYRLPSEAEWEYAARAGSTGARFWSARDSHEGVSLSRACDFANVYDVMARDVPWLGAPAGAPYARCADGYGELAPVGSFQPNAFGVFDVIGNLRERTADCYTASYKGRPADERAWQWADCPLQVARGGSYRSRPFEARSAARSLVDDSRLDSLVDVGIRVARDLSDAEIAAWLKP
jgi:formylglycine-generating enzyme required for sulfatase activity